MPLNVLVIDRSPPVSSSQGNDLIARNLFPRLRADHRLTLVSPVVTGEEAETRVALDGLFDAIHLVPRRRRMTSLIGWVEPALARRGIRMSGRLDSDFAARMRAEVQRLLAAEAIDVIHVRQLAAAAYAADLGTTPRLLELIDSEALASNRDASGTLRAAIRRRLARAIERRAVRPFPIVTTVADADADAVRRNAPGSRVDVVPNGVDAVRFSPQPGVAARPGSIAFVGAMSFPPNVAAVEWFAAAVLPRIRAVRPDATFTIVGRDPAPAVVALGSMPAVEVTGSVDDVRPYLARAAVVVAPMVSGSGIKNKVLEALAMGRAVVATPMAVEGLRAEPGRHLLVADGPDAFAAAVEALLQDPARAAVLGASGRSLVESLYTWEACAARYAAIYAELAAGAESPR